MPVSQFLNIHTETANVTIMRFNEYNAMEIDGTNSASGSSGGALNTMMQLAAPISKAATCRSGMTYEWSGIARQQVQSGPADDRVFAMGLLFVFLVLVAQYESMTTPFVIMLAVPLALLGAVGGIFIRRWADVIAYLIHSPRRRTPRADTDRIERHLRADRLCHADRSRRRRTRFSSSSSQTNCASKAAIRSTP